MKKLSFVLGFVALMAFTTTSCKKEYTCECTTTDASGNETSVSGKLEKMKKDEAEDKCNEGDVSFMGSTIECELE